MKGLICIGTSVGAVQVYGNGFQYLQPWIHNEPNSITFMLIIHPDKLIVTYQDNSLALFTLPNLLPMDQLMSTWLDKKYGDISFIHVDEPSLKPFTYIGTTSGAVLIVDTSGISFRIVDYMILPLKLGIPNDIKVSEIQLCPKDEKYLAIGYGDSINSNGYVIIYDLVKQKVYKQFATSSVSSLQWSHTGEHLYVGKLRVCIYND